MSRNEDLILELFTAKIADMGLSIEAIDEDGLIHIDTGTNTLQISLDNVRKSYQQDGDLEHLDKLIESIHFYLMEIPVPSWEECRRNVYLSLFPSNHDFGDCINISITPVFSKHFLYYDGNQFMWITRKQLEEWEVSQETFISQVQENMRLLLDESNLEVSVLKSGEQLGFIETAIPELKAALLFADNLKDKVSSTFGWPVYCVLPVRDFCYIFSSKDKESLTEKLGTVVLKEFEESGYAITKEIIEISDEGIKAIGTY